MPNITVEFFASLYPELDTALIEQAVELYEEDVITTSELHSFLRIASHIDWATSVADSDSEMSDESYESSFIDDESDESESI